MKNYYAKVTIKQSLEGLIRSGAFTTDSAGELHVLGHDGNTFGVDGAKVGVLEEANHVSFSGFLESENSGALETKVVLELSGDLTDESLEGELSDEELGALLETSDFTESNGSGSEAMGLLDTTSGSGLLGSLLVGNVLSGGFASGVLACGVLCAGHYFDFNIDLLANLFIGGLHNISILIGYFRLISYISLKARIIADLIIILC